MKNILKYLGLASLLLFSFYYTEKMQSVVLNNSVLVSEIKDNSEEYNISPVSAIIEDDYIIPGLNGYSVNVLKSYNNMRFLDTFNSYYLEYDKVIPNISLENNKDKIIKYGNKNKKSVAIIVKDNLDIIDYSKSKNIHITRLIDYNTYDKEAKYEQLNNDLENYKKIEVLLNNTNSNKNICFVDKVIPDVCLNAKKYLVEPSLTLNNYNFATIKENIKSGYIIYINDLVSLTDYKLLLKEIRYHDLQINYVSKLITEERD